MASTSLLAPAALRLHVRRRGHEATVSILQSSNSCLQDVSVPAPHILQFTLFCSLNIGKSSPSHRKVITCLITWPTRHTNYPNVFCYKTLHVSGILSAHHQEFFYCTFSTGKFHAGFQWLLPSRVRMELSWLYLDAVIKDLHETYQCWMYSGKLQMMGREIPSWLCLEAVKGNLHETYQCRMYSRKLLMVGREDAWNM